MGISASYISQDGGARFFDLEGAPEPGSVAAGLLGAHATPTRLPQMGAVPLTMPSAPQMPELPAMSDNMDVGKVKVSAGDIPDVLERKLLPNGSIVASGNMLCLSGEEGGTPGGRRLYAAADGVKGFLTFSQIDPYAGGITLVGSGDNVDGASVQMDGKNGASIRFGRSHTAVEIAPSGERWLVVKDFYRIADISPNGRVTRVSGEVEVLVAKILLGGGGRWEVRPVKNQNDQVTEFLFGAASDLGSESDDVNEIREKDTVTSVKVLTCPGGA